MMKPQFTAAELESYLDESLCGGRAAEIESQLRSDDSLAGRLAEIAGRRDAGLHTLGGIWRSHRLSCPTREQLGSYLLGVLDEGEADYVEFHLEEIGCRACQASLADLKAQHAATDEKATVTRRQKYFQSSAGYLSQSGD